jgi:hypothetical protein
VDGKVSYGRGSLGGRLIKILTRPPFAVGEEVADLDVEHLGDSLDVVEVEGDLASDATRDVHR